MKRVFRIISINFIVFIFLLVIVEALLHVVPPFDRLVTYYDAETRDRKKGANEEYTYLGNDIGMISEFKVRIKNNSLGLHDSEHIFFKKANTYRILVLGDSQVEAVQVDLSKTFFKILEQKFNNEGFHIEVIALGKSGYGPKEAVDFYENIGRKYNPDLVIWSFTNNNDIQDSYREFGRIIRNRKLEGFSEIPDFLKFSKIASYLYTREWKNKELSSAELRDTTFFSGEFSYINEINNWDQIVFLNHWPPIFEQAWDSFTNYYLDLIEKVHNDGKIFVTISSSGAIPYFLLRSNENINWDFDKPNRLVKKLSEENSVKFISMKSTYDLFIKTGKDVVFPYDGHLNETGHQLLAKILHREIKNYLPPQNNP